MIQLVPKLVLHSYFALVCLFRNSSSFGHLKVRLGIQIFGTSKIERVRHKLVLFC